jgi:phospholipase C
MGVSRRDVLKLGAAGAVLAACGDDAAPGGADAAATPDGGAPPDAPVAADAALPDAPAPMIDAGVDAAPPDGAPPDAPVLSPTELLGAVDTIVVLMMENRSFDHYLGSLKLLEGRAVDGLELTMSNPSSSGSLVLVHQLDDFTPDDPPHSWDPVHAQWNGGAMDGFVKAHAGASEADVMGYHVRSQLPVTYAMADAFTVCDRWFCSVLGPTWPNRFYLHGATSNGQRSNLPVPGFTSIFHRLDDAGIGNKNYYADLAWAAGGYFKLNGLANLQSFFDDAAAGTLPPFSIVDPAFFGAGANDDHPDHDVRLGQAFIASVYAALRASPKAATTMLVVTYDEHGGFFDHVPPPTCVDDQPDFRQLGVRVPTIVCGGPVRRGAIVSTTFEHSSVAATATLRWGLQPLNARAGAAADLSPCIDPALVGAPPPWPELPPPPVISLTKLRALDARLRAEPRPPRSHRELWDLAEAGRIPRALDRRATSLATAEMWLREGARLGALRLVE